MPWLLRSPSLRDLPGNWTELLRRPFMHPSLRRVGRRRGGGDPLLRHRGNVYAGGKAEDVLRRWMKTKDRRALTIATKCRWRMWAGPNGEGAGRKHIMYARP